MPDTTYHYYRWSGDSGVYMCDSGTYEAFEYTAQMLCLWSSLHWCPP